MEKPCGFACCVESRDLALVYKLCVDGCCRQGILYREEGNVVFSPGGKSKSRWGNDMAKVLYSDGILVELLASARSAPSPKVRIDTRLAYFS